MCSVAQPEVTSVTTAPVLVRYSTIAIRPPGLQIQGPSPDEGVYKAMATPNGRMPGFAMVDGRVVGSWRIDAIGTVSVEYLTDVPASRRKALDAEAEAVSQFARRSTD